MNKNINIGVLLLLLSPLSIACQSEHYRQFDFWLGKWQVSNPSNNQISSSKISLINNGCGILEEYSTPSGYQGKSLNIYNVQTGKWHQTWTDNTGLLLQLNGEFKNGKMVLIGETLSQQGKRVTNQISWQLLKDGRVNQVWKTSMDDGKTWQTVFNGFYEMLNSTN